MDETKTNKCIVCGEKFTVKSSQKKICSSRCRKKRQLFLTKKWAQENPEKTTNSRKKWFEGNEIKRKECANKYYHKNKKKSKEYREINKEKISKKRKKHYNDNKEKIKKQREKNKESLSKKSREYYKKNKEKVKENNKKWIKENRDHKSMLTHLRREKEKKTKGFSDKIESFKIRMEEIGECVFCGSKENITIDHLIPISKGGSNEINNLFPACRSCNSSKNASDWLEWYRKRECYSLEKECKIIELHKTNQKT